MPPGLAPQPIASPAVRRLAAVPDAPEAREAEAADRSLPVLASAPSPPPPSPSRAPGAHRSRPPAAGGDARRPRRACAAAGAASGRDRRAPDQTRRRRDPAPATAPRPRRAAGPRRGTAAAPAGPLPPPRRIPSTCASRCCAGCAPSCSSTVSAPGASPTSAEGSIDGRTPTSRPCHQPAVRRHDRRRRPGHVQRVRGPRGADRHAWSTARAAQNGFTYKLPGRLSFTPIVLTRAVDGQKGSLAPWFTAFSKNRGGGKTGAITAYDGMGLQVTQWSLIDVYPSRWTGPRFGIDGAGVANETLELTHNGFTADLRHRALPLADSALVKASLEAPEEEDIRRALPCSTRPSTPSRRTRAGSRRPPRARRLRRASTRGTSAMTLTMDVLFVRQLGAATIRTSERGSISGPGRCRR